MGIFGAFIFIGLGLLTYLGIKTANFLIAKVPPQEQVMTMTQTISDKGKDLIVQVAPVNCWLTFQSYLNLNIWMTKPFSENTDNLIKACLSGPPPDQKSKIKNTEEEKNDQSHI